MKHEASCMKISRSFVMGADVLLDLLIATEKRI